MKIFKYILCKLNGHILDIDAGSCPYTGKTYKACRRCERLEAI